MKVTISLDENLAKCIRRIASERNTTVSGLIREYLNHLALAESGSDRRSNDLRALEHSFEKYQFTISKRAWHRADLHARS